jgi:hypothetical protein
MNRVSGQSNLIERLMTTVAAFAPLGIVILAGIAIPAYLYRLLTAPLTCVAERES